MYLALKVIDHKPKVDPNDPKSKIEIPNLKGSIVFEKVNFTYPTR